MSLFAIIGAVLLLFWFWRALAGSGEMKGLGDACGWYWRQGLWTPLTAALFLYLVVGIVYSLYNWIFLTFYLNIAIGNCSEPSRASYVFLW